MRVQGGGLLKILPIKASKSLKKWTFGPKHWRFIQILLYWRFNQEWSFICVDTVINFGWYTETTITCQSCPTHCCPDQSCPDQSCPKSKLAQPKLPWPKVAPAQSCPGSKLSLLKCNKKASLKSKQNIAILSRIRIRIKLGLGLQLD